MFKLSIEKKSRLRWIIWFCLGNAALFWLIGLNYLSSIPWLGTDYLTFRGQWVFLFFLLVSYVGQLAFVAGCLGFLLAPLFFIQSTRVFLIISVSLASLVSLWLLIDTFVYSFYRFHLNGIILNLAIDGFGESVFDLSRVEILMVVSFIVLLLTIEWVYAKWLWQRTLASAKWIIGFLIFCLYLSYSMVVLSASSETNRIFVEGIRFLPGYTEILGLVSPSKNGQLILERATENFTVQPKKANQLISYPLQTLQYSNSVKPLNLVMIAIDTWRFDMLNTQVTPNIRQFANQAWVFTNHMSGGNSTGPGFFSLFYGIPATYWTAMEKQKKGPVLLDEFIKRNYQIGVFSSAQLFAPPLHKTVFQAVPNLEIHQQPGNTMTERDRVITDKFKQFLDQASKNPKPFYSFILYKAAHAYCLEDESTGPFQPVVNQCNRLTLSLDNYAYYINRYQNGLYHVDQQVKEVLAALQSRDLLKNTIVLITGDHGEEFDDNRLGFWGHASNFTRYQVQTPLIVYWPGEQPAVFHHQTSHFDVVPTLMTRMLGCLSPINTYSVGADLLELKPRSYFVLSSYTNIGILESDKVTTIFPSGHYQVNRLDGQAEQKVAINKPVMIKAFQEMRQFFIR